MTHDKLTREITAAIRSFESDTNSIVKSIRLVRKDHPEVFHGKNTDLVDLEITIRG